MLKYCGRCGALFTQKTNRLYICKTCGFNFFLPPSSCNAIILENPKSEILLVKRKDDPFKDYWDIPGGFIDFNETVEQSLIREIKEEIGFNLKEFSYFGSYFDKYLFQEVEYHILCMAFTGIIANETLKPADDVTEAKFFVKNKIPWKKLAFKNVKRALEDYLKKRN